MYFRILFFVFKEIYDLFDYKHYLTIWYVYSNIYINHNL